MSAQTTLPARAAAAMPATRRRLLPVAPRTRRVGSAGRLAAMHAVVLAVVLGGVVAALVRNFTLSYQSLAGQLLVAQARSFQQAAAGRPAGQDPLSFTESYLRTHDTPAGSVVVVSVPNRGTVGSGGAGEVLADPAVRALLAAPPGASAVREATVDGTPTELLTAPVTVSGRPVGVFLATADLSSFADERSRLLAVSLVGAAAALLTAVVSAFLLLRRLLRQVGEITTTADEISRGDLHRRLGDQGTDDEVGQLARSFDTMLDHLDTAVTAQRRLLSDVSHQLRTPLTVARGHLEVLERTQLADPGATRETIDIVIDELDHMHAMVDRLLLLGRAMEAPLRDGETIDLRDLLGDLFESCQVIAAREWLADPVPDVLLRGDPAMLRGALLNLVENAIGVTAEADPIAVRAALAGGARVAVSVEDAGPGIPVSERGAVLGRFSRPGARSAGGTGLGLAIAKAVAEAHGGRLEIGDSALGGARVTLLLPVLDRAARS